MHLLKMLHKQTSQSQVVASRTALVQQWLICLCMGFEQQLNKHPADMVAADIRSHQLC